MSQTTSITAHSQNYVWHSHELSRPIKNVGWSIIWINDGVSSTVIIWMVYTNRRYLSTTESCLPVVPPACFARASRRQRKWLELGRPAYQTQLCLCRRKCHKQPIAAVSIHTHCLSKAQDGNKDYLLGGLRWQYHDCVIEVGLYSRKCGEVDTITDQTCH